MSKFDDIKIPSNIDEVTKKAIKRGKVYKNKIKYKKIMIASVTFLAVGTSIVGILNPSIADSIPMVQKILDYFKDNDESLYKTDKEDFKEIGKDLNLTTQDKGIELTIDSVVVDDNYITIFHTVKSDKNIKEMNEVYKDADLANPILHAYINNKNIGPWGLLEYEAKYISDYELKGINKIDVSDLNIENGTEIEFKTDEIFGVEGNWSIFTKIDKSKALKDTYNYDVNKDFVINQVYDYDGEKVDIRHDINIKKVIISPLANQVVINEKIDKAFNDWEPIIGNRFALFDQDGKSLDVVDKGGSGVNSKTGIATNSEEFLKADKNTKSLTLVPIIFDESIEENMMEPKSIDNLPITLEMSEHGKIVIEDIKITDKEIRYTYYKDGVVPYGLGLWFFDKNGKELNINSTIKESIDRRTGRYTTILELEEHDNNLDDIRNISKVSTSTQNSMRLLYDKQIKIDLEKDNNK